MKVLPSGERAVLVEVDGAAAAHALAAQVRGSCDVLEEVVPGASTVLLVARTAADLPAVRALVSAPTGAAKPLATSAVDIPVRYDGEDLHAVAAATGMSVDDVIARHCGAVYTVEFIGFAPGFGYLSGLDPALHVPRLDSPRPAVPAGSVAIAGAYSAIYPRSSPGGWHLLGRTEVRLFDVDAQPPSLLQAGVTVRFVAT